MKTESLILAIRAWHYEGELDAIGFRSLDEAERFCEARPEYQVYETQFLTVPEALAIFGEVKA